jgi:hypothetical protein
LTFKNINENANKVFLIVCIQVHRNNLCEDAAFGYLSVIYVGNYCMSVSILLMHDLITNDFCLKIKKN